MDPSRRGRAQGSRVQDARDSDSRHILPLGQDHHRPEGEGIQQEDDPRHSTRQTTPAPLIQPWKRYIGCMYGWFCFFFVAINFSELLDIMVLGLWRMQVEHLCSHFRAYAQGSVDFQNSIGSAQIGKVYEHLQLEKKSHMDQHDSSLLDEESCSEGAWRH